MKQLLITIAAVVVVGCSKPPPPDISIHDAAKKGNIEAVKQHLAAGTDVNAAIKWTPLHYAAGEGHKGIAELLIAKGANVNAKIVSGLFQGQTPLDVAEKAEHTEIADLLRKNGAKTSDWLNAFKSIHKAAKAGHIEAVKKHLAAGADVNAKDRYGYTALGRAVSVGHKETAELLIAKGADVNITALGKTLLDTAIKRKHTEIADLLRKHGGKKAAKPEPTKTKAPPSFSKIHTAAQMGMIELVKQHLAVGEDVNAKGVLFKGTPLHSAAMGGRKEVIELLIAKGADLNAKDSRGRTPLDWAISQFQTKTADLLRKHGGKTGEELKAEGK